MAIKKIAVGGISTECSTYSPLYQNESIDKVGPFDCKFTLKAIDDVRASKKEDKIGRASCRERV